MLGRLFVPLEIFGPRGIPDGERFDIRNDEDPEWNDLMIRVYSANSSALSRDHSVTLESLQQSLPATHRPSGLVYSQFPLEGGRPAVMRRAKVLCTEPSRWVPLSTLFKGLQRAFSSVASGNMKAARNTFESLMTHKLCSTVMAHYGAFCATQGDDKSALELFREAAALNPHNPLVLTLFGQCIAGSDPSRAQKAFRTALQADSYDSDALAGLGSVLTQDGRHSEEAVNVLRRALLLGDQPAAQHRLATISARPTGATVARADRAKEALAEEEASNVESISLYLDHLNFERQALFPE